MDQVAVQSLADMKASLHLLCLRSPSYAKHSHCSEMELVQSVSITTLDTTHTIIIIIELLPQAVSYRLYRVDIVARH